MPELMTMLGDITGRSAAVPMIPFTPARMAAHFSPLYARLTRTKALLTDTAIHTLTTPFSISDGKAREQLGYTSLAIEQSVSDALDWYREAGYLQRQAPTPSTYARLHRKVLTFLREKFPLPFRELT